MEAITTFSEDRLVAAIEQNLVAFFKENPFSDFPGAEVFIEPHLLQAVTNEPIPLLNPVLGAQLSPDTVESAIDTAVKGCKMHGVPMLWWVGPISKPDDLGSRLEAKGLSQVAEAPGMILDLARLPEEQALPAGLTITKVLDDATAAIWGKALIAGFGMPEAWLEPVSKLMDAGRKKGSRTFRNYLGWLNGEPVGTASVFLGAGVAGIYNVMAHESARGQGVGRAMTIAPLLDAKKEGYRFSILHSSEMGHSVYRKIGYQDYAKMRQYLWTPD